MSQLFHLQMKNKIWMKNGVAWNYTPLH